MNDHLVFRRMEPEDAAVVAALEKACFSEPWSEQAFAGAAQNPDAYFVTVWLKDELVGYCGVFRAYTDGDICNVAVRDTARRNGIGKRMLTLLMEQGSKMGILSYTLEVRAGNLAAIALYESLGFVSEGVRPHFYTKPDEDALIMWKRKETVV